MREYYVSYILQNSISINAFSFKGLFFKISDKDIIQCPLSAAAYEIREKYPTGDFTIIAISSLN